MTAADRNHSLLTATLNLKLLTETQIHSMYVQLYFNITLH